MDEEFDTSVDTSDVDTSADMDTLDVVDDVPDDIPDDIPEDVPEDEPEMTGEDDLSEDIPEDVPEDEPELTEENDLSDDIPEDVPEDEPEMTGEDDLTEDIPEDVPEDEPELTEENDLSDALPEDVPENEPELTEEDDLSEDIPEDVPDDEPEMTEEDDLPDDISEDVSDDEPEPMENDFTEDRPEDVSDDESESMKDDLQDAFEEQDEDASDNDDSTTDEVSEETTSETEDTDAAEQISDTQDEPLDDTATNEVSEETTSDTEDTDAAEQVADTQDEPLDDTATDEVSEETTSETEDTDAAEQISDTQSEQLDDTATDEPNELPTTEQYGASLDDASINEAIGNEASEDELSDNYEEANAYESRLADDAVSDIDEKSAMDRMSDYMNSHNYGLDDKDTYMSDPEWISINRDLKAELGIPQTAQEQMMDYMGSHNYGIWDRETYMKDPEWQSLNEALQNEIAGVDTTNSLVENDIVDPTEEKRKISDFFANIFGSSAQQNEPPNGGVSFASDDEVNSLDITSQILQQPDDVNDNISEEQDLVKEIEGMDFNDLSDEDKDLMYNTAKEHIGEKYGDLVSEYRLDEIPKHIKIADTEECRKAYEASGEKYSDNTVGFYCPATDEIYVDAPRNGDMTEIMATIEHESLHLASNGGLNGKLEIVEGMSTYRRNTNLNEGVTELYAMMDMEEMGFDYTSTSYQQQVEVVKALEDAIGKDTIRTAYFNNQPDLIRSEFETAFASESEVQSLEVGKTIHNGTYIDFLNSLDQYIATDRRDPNYDSRRDTVFNWISNLKAKRRIN